MIFYLIIVRKFNILIKENKYAIAMHLQYLYANRVLQLCVATQMAFFDINQCTN